MSKNFILPGVVNCSEAPMSDFPEVIKYFVWIIAFEELRHIGVLEAPGPEKNIDKTGYRYIWMPFELEKQYQHEA